MKTLHGNYELTAGGVSVELSYVNGCFGPVKTDSGFVIQNHYSHIHDCIEIYINLSGRVSFIVNNLIFPVCRGDMIITSPGEYHRCVVHEYPHEHMCLWIRDKGESPLLAKLKKKNIIMLPLTTVKKPKERRSFARNFAMLLGIRQFPTPKRRCFSPLCLSLRPKPKQTLSQS